MTSLLVLALLRASDAGSTPDAGPAPLVPRALLFGNAELASPQLSPDGLKVAFLKPDPNDVVQLWVRTVGAADDVQLTSEPSRSLRSFRWAEDASALLYPQDLGGDERFHLFVVELATKATRDLTPWPGSRNELLETSPKAPDFALVTSNRRDARAADVLRLNWKSGAVELDTRNPGDVTQWLVDADFKVRGAKAALANGGSELRVRDTVKSPWRALITASLEENLRPWGFTLDGKSLLLASTISSDTDRVIEKSLKTGTERLLATNAKSDVVDVSWNRATSSLRAVAFEVNGRREWTSLDWLFPIEVDQLRAFGSGELDIVSTDRLDVKWVVSFSSDTQPPTYLVWDRKAKQATPIGSAFPKLATAVLSPVTPVTIPARDGLGLQAFLTVPAGASPVKRPLVVLVHGGPWWRDRLGFHPNAQWLANRGAAVLQVNYRGSTGYGKRFVTAGNRQWGLAMQDDLSDAVAWAVKEGVADPARVAIMGQSYGGYATLMGLAKTPELYRCGVDLVGPANLFTLLAAVPPWWKAQEATFFRRVGNPNDPKDKELLTAASPAFIADRITAPLLIGQGENDPRVKPSESEQIVSAMRAASRQVTYVVYPDEGHGLTRAANRLDFAARAEAFLATCLGLRSEPLPKGGSVAGSSAQLR
ncbi:MAG: S9 family peptidase [Myxococcaceae bacterium]|nr:S9 family peptidase [Myxococcaceae bacterium]